MSGKEQYIPTKGELVMVANELPLEEGNTFFVQKFVIQHNGLYFCERDDGVFEELIGWKFLIKNQGHEIIEMINSGMRKQA